MVASGRPLVPGPRRLIAAATATATALLLGLGTMSAAAEPTTGAASGPGTERYIVTLAERPIATYNGDVPGLPATKPARGQRVDVGTAKARRYRDHLERRQDQAAARVGAQPDRRFAVALNGFSTSLTPVQARTLQRSADVLSVVKDTARQPTDDKNSVDFLRLSGPRGVWSRLGGEDRAGRGVVVGVIDTGIWPESRSFSGSTLPPAPADPVVAEPYRVGSQIRMLKSDGGTFVGSCEPGEDAAGQFSGNECNTKIVAARAFDAGYKTGVPADQRTDYLSPRDGDGHGTHTGSTAVGNAGVPVTVQGKSFGAISGVAPAAKIASYKVCYTSVANPGASCYASDSLAAVEQAVIDGVDVINYSISSSDTVNDPVDLAFLSAASAGVFVAASAGNSGPTASTVDHVVPWLTTVAASTVAPYAATVVLGDGTRYAGIGTTLTADVGPAPLVAAAAVKLSAAAAADASRCIANTLDPAQVAGKIVVCDRGVNARVEKSDEVARAGGVGMVLVNLTESSTDGDIHAVPTVHLNVPGSLAVRAYAQTSGASATLVDGNAAGIPIHYPQVAGFSSRGPSVGNGGDLLKPDVAAPGVATLAAVAPPSNSGREFDFYSGTSMASPHVAGLAALYFGHRPTWSPMAVKSALMTTASDTRNADGSVNRDAYAQGSGNVRPDRMFAPGVVFDAGEADWLGFLEGQGLETGTEVAAIDPSDYNSPSIAVGALVGTQTVTRRVTAVEPGRYRARISVPGVDAQVSPSFLTFSAANQTKTITVTLSNRDAPLAEAASGSLTLQGRGKAARVPVVVTPRAISAPALVRGAGVSGSLSYDVTPGFTGQLTLAPIGLAPVQTSSGELRVDPARYTADVPVGTAVARFRAVAADAAADIDLAVYRVVDGVPVPVEQSATSSGTEEVLLRDPEPGSYLSVVTPFAHAAGQTSTAYEFQSAAVGPAVGNYTVSPADASVSNGVPLTLTVRWSGLQAETDHLGWIGYPDGTGTLVEVDGG